MIKAKPLALAQKLTNIVDICEAADTEIENQKLIQKGALDAGKENDGIEPAVVRKIIARRKRIAKDPAETTRLEDLMTDYQFMLGEGREDTRPWTQADDEVSRVMALTNTSKPPKIATAPSPSSRTPPGAPTTCPTCSAARPSCCAAPRRW